jgi:hypothetical protein
MLARDLYRMVQIFGGNGVLLESREDVVKFIMAGAEEEGQPLEFNFLSEEDVESALDDVRQVLLATPSGPRKKRKSSINGKKRGPPQKTVAIKCYHLPPASRVPKRLRLDDTVVKQHIDTGYGYRKVDSKGKILIALLEHSRYATNV